MKARERDVVQILIAFDDVTPDQRAQPLDADAEFLRGFVFGVLRFRWLAYRESHVWIKLYCILGESGGGPNRALNLNEILVSLTDFRTGGVHLRCGGVRFVFVLKDANCQRSLRSEPLRVSNKQVSRPPDP